MARDPRTSYLPMACPNPRCRRLRLVCEIKHGDRGPFVAYILCEKCHLAWGTGPSGEHYDGHEGEGPHPDSEDRII